MSGVALSFDVLLVTAVSAEFKALKPSPFKVRVTSPRASAPPLSIDGEGLSPCFQVVCHLLAGKSPLAIHGEGAHGSAG